VLATRPARTRRGAFVDGRANPCLGGIALTDSVTSALATQSAHVTALSSKAEHEHCPDSGHPLVPQQKPPEPTLSDAHAKLLAGSSVSHVQPVALVVHWMPTLLPVPPEVDPLDDDPLEDPVPNWHELKPALHTPLGHEPHTWYGWPPYDTSAQSESELQTFVCVRRNASPLQAAAGLSFNRACRG
jgi:hypothetical protein